MNIKIILPEMLMAIRLFKFPRSFFREKNVLHSTFSSYAIFCELYVKTHIFPSYYIIHLFTLMPKKSLELRGIPSLVYRQLSKRYFDFCKIVLEFYMRA